LTADRDKPAPQIALRLPADLEAAIDAVREQIARQHEGLTVTRSDAVRVLLREALQHRAAA
jgi:Arc/MetJ-type ribon-helix-helix transcriptional regulator